MNNNIIVDRNSEGWPKQPSYYQFSAVAHYLSNLVGVIFFILFYSFFDSLGVSSNPNIFNEPIFSEKYLTTIPIIFIISIVTSFLTSPATWLCLLIAKKMKLTTYWQFSLLGIIGTIISTFVVFIILFNLDVIVGFKLLIPIMSWVSLIFTPAGMVAGLVYRKLASYPALI